MSAAALSPYLLASAKKSYDSSPSNRVAQNAMSSNDPLTVLLNRDHAALNHQHHYSVRLSKELKATSQKASGRCWIFACLNVMRNQMAKKYDLPDTFQLSQTYTFYWDKLERANYFLNQIIDSKSEPLDERLVQHLLSCPMNDGGQVSRLGAQRRAKIHANIFIDVTLTLTHPVGYASWCYREVRCCAAIRVS